MEYIMTTFRMGKREEDLKLPSFIKVEELLSILSECLNFALNSKNRLQAEPLGRILDNDKTLQDEGVGTGSILTLI